VDKVRQARGLLAAWLKVPAEADEEFNDWYNTEHLSQIASVPGFLNGRRYRAIADDPWYLALYDLEAPGVIFDAPFQKVIADPTPWSRRMKRHYGPNRIRNTYETVLSLGDPAPPASPWVFMAKIEIDPAVEAEFNEWYSEEHAPALAAVPGVARVRRFVAAEGEPKYAAIYELASPEVLETEAWAHARELGRTQRMRTHMLKVERCCYKRIFATDVDPRP